jgi:plastocyanin
LAAIRSDGYLFELDRETGAPILSVEERPVPQLTSQMTSPTQPFPGRGDSVLMSCDEWRRERIPAGFVLGCMWTAPASATDPQNVLAPFPAVRATPLAYSPITGYFYAQGTSMLGWPRRSPDPFFFDFSTAVPGLKAYKHLVAIDSRTGKVVWRTPIPAYVDHGLPTHLSGGPLVTAGGLLFQSLGDGNVAGFDAVSGAVVWRFQTGMAGYSGAPATYEIDGEQYIAVPMGAAVWAFKLGGKLASAPGAVLQSAPEEEFTGPVIDTAQIATTSLVTTVSGSAPRYFIDEHAFHPYRARVNVGTQVLFVNNGDVGHEVVALDGSWGTGPLSPTQEAYVRFEKPGHYTYICKDHPWAYGEIIVVAANSPLSSSVSGKIKRGREQFLKHCSACHGEDLSGRATAPALAGSTFLLHWKGTSFDELYDRIRTTMPQGGPGSLGGQTYLNIVTYLLRANDLLSSHEGMRRRGYWRDSIRPADVEAAQVE